MKKLSQTVVMPDEILALAGPKLILDTVRRLVGEMVRNKADLSTLDLRIFRDVDLATGEREHHLTARATALTHPETPDDE